MLYYTKVYCNSSALFPQQLLEWVCLHTWVGVSAHMGGHVCTCGWACLHTWVGVSAHMGGHLHTWVGMFSHVGGHVLTHGWACLHTWVGVSLHMGGCVCTHGWVREKLPVLLN